MSEQCDWQEEQRSILNRLFDSVFRRREASEDAIGADIHRLSNTRPHGDESRLPESCP
jgi:hypothetical protein